MNGLLAEHLIEIKKNLKSNTLHAALSIIVAVIVFIGVIYIIHTISLISSYFVTNFENINSSKRDFLTSELTIFIAYLAIAGSLFVLAVTNALDSLGRHSEFSHYLNEQKM